MRSGLVLVTIILVLCTALMSGCSGPEQGIQARIWSGVAGHAINISERQMENYPHLKQAILTNKTVTMGSPSQEMDYIRGVFEYFDPQDIYPDIILYQNVYYEIRIYYAD
jgi:ABC-type lipoprotein release transport system permease subunit